MLISTVMCHHPANCIAVMKQPPEKNAVFIKLCYRSTPYKITSVCFLACSSWSMEPVILRIRLHV